jgi:hypothetical protein
MAIVMLQKLPRDRTLMWEKDPTELPGPDRGLGMKLRLYSPRRQRSQRN